jgi:hypothetical protein
MTSHELREAIATEAARLILRGKAPEYHSARIRASRWLSKRKLSADEMPSNAEIQAKLQALACLFLEERLASAGPDDPLDDEEVAEDEPDGDNYHPDTFPLLRILLSRLDGVKLDPVKHPEGDALYHSLQVYELGLAARPYDEEFLMACLVHDVGLALDRRRPVDAALEALGPVLTERTCFFIERLSEGIDYLRTGQAPRSLRNSPDFDELVLLARCDLNGRVPGADVGTLEEAIDYIAGLEQAWDDA